MANPRKSMSMYSKLYRRFKMKYIFMVIVGMIICASSAMATSFNLIGGIIVSGPVIGTPIVINLEVPKPFLTKHDCEYARRSYLINQVTQADSNTAGEFSSTQVWTGAGTVTKTDLTACVPSVAPTFTQ